MLRDHCGVVGVAAESQVSNTIFNALRMLQHRGQESAGMAVHAHDTLIHKDMGLVHQVFNPTILEYLRGTVGIGHVRYSTTGGSSLENAQPIFVDTAEGQLALVHNGDLVNAQQLRDHYKTKGWAFTTTGDSEIIIRLLARYLADTHDMIRSIRTVMKEIKGSYSMVIMYNGKVYGVRDPYGIKPLVLGKIVDGHMVSSESVALDLLDGEVIRDVMPGEIVEVGAEIFKSSPGGAALSPAHCMFEWVYFARADSVLDTKLAYEVRRRIGKALARAAPVDADFVVPVPDSGRAHAIGYSYASGVPYAEGLMKNRYVDRTFIMPSQLSREMSIKLKLNPIRPVIEDKSIVLVDDSIVRGTTMRQIVQLLFKFGAKEVHIRVGSPPIIAPCYFGVDIKHRKYFIANGRSVEEIREILGATSLRYITVDELVEAIELPYDHLCLGCVTGEYPLPIPGEKTRFQARLDSFRQE